jgi:hypothetical protein
VRRQQQQQPDLGQWCWWLAQSQQEKGDWEHQVGAAHKHQVAAQPLCNRVQCALLGCRWRGVPAAVNCWHSFIFNSIFYKLNLLFLIIIILNSILEHL